MPRAGVSQPDRLFANPRLGVTQTQNDGRVIERHHCAEDPKRVKTPQGIGTVLDHFPKENND